MHVRLSVYRGFGAEAGLEEAEVLGGGAGGEADSEAIAAPGEYPVFPPAAESLQQRVLEHPAFELRAWGEDGGRL